MNKEFTEDTQTFQKLMRDGKSPVSRVMKIKDSFI